MRIAYHDTQFVKNTDNNVVGINLGYDYTAEHEWGTKELKQLLGIWNGDPKTETNVMGFDRHVVTKPDSIRRVTVKDWVFITTYSKPSWSSSTETDEEYFKKLFGYSMQSTNKEVISAWDSKNFVFGSKDTKAMDTLYTAFKEKRMLNAVVGTDNPFGRSGLYFGIYDYLTREDEKDVIKHQTNFTNMWKKIRDTKIEERLIEAGKKYYDLSPRIVTDNKAFKSSKLPDIKFWLNPMYQTNNNYGWYTIEDLEEWIDDKGKIPK